MSNQIHPRLLEEVRRHHYQREDYLPSANILTTYNCCPFCGTIYQIGAREVPEHGNPIIEVEADISKCITCAAMSARYPEPTAYIKQVVQTQIFMLGLKDSNNESIVSSPAIIETSPDDGETIH